MEVFILEQKSFYLDLDGIDQQAVHFMGIDQNKLVVYGRVYIDSIKNLAEIRRVVVHSDFRKQNLGTLLIYWILLIHSPMLL